MSEPGHSDSGPTRSSPFGSAPGWAGRAGAGGAPPRRGPSRRRPWLRWVAVCTAALVLVVSGVAWSVYERLDGNIRTDVSAAEELERYENERPAASGGAQNVLLLGSDSRGGENGAYGHDSGSQRSDTTILLHISGDRKSATGVSIPRDLMVSVPACNGSDGIQRQAEFAPFNTAFERGGSACTIRTVEQLTGVRVDHHLVVDFDGFKKLVDAVNGVDVCLPQPVNDADAQLSLPAGRQTLGGEEALGYVRSRNGMGNGSDTQRMERQQQFLGSLVKKVHSEGVLLNPTKIYPVLDAATSALTGDSGLDSLRELYELVRSVRDIPKEQVRFLTVPRKVYQANRNRDELVQPQAGELFTRLRNDSPVQVADPNPGSQDIDDAERPSPGHAAPEDGQSGNGDKGSEERNGNGAGTGESPEDQSTYRGTTAARDICATNAAENGAN